MLNFEIKLSLLTCEVLTDLVEYTDILDKKNSELEMEAWSKVCLNKSHFITHGQVLIRNGLATHSGRTWRVTPKGRLMAKVIQIELAEATKRTKRKAKQ